MARVKRVFRITESAGFEECFVFAIEGEFDTLELGRLLGGLLQERPDMRVSARSAFADGERVSEVGPRLAIETPDSSNRLVVLHQGGHPEVTRAECFRRYRIPDGVDPHEFLGDKFDPMTEQVYPEPVTSFETNTVPEPVRVIQVLERGMDALREENERLGLGIKDDDLAYFQDLCRNTLKRNPTDVELFQFGQMGSNHSRHRDWKARVVLDGVVQPHTLMDLVQMLFRARRGNCVIGFHDNASSIGLGEAYILMPESADEPSRLVRARVNADGTLTVETHNHPTRIAPWPGAETGIGGCYRDIHACGRGGLILFSIAGFATGNLRIPGYVQPWEPEFARVPGGASALQIMREAPGGTWDYGNKYGVPVPMGYARTADFDIRGQRIGYAKPIMLAGNVGMMLHEHAEKGVLEPGMPIVMIGGPAYRIGFGGGTASSQGAGDVSEELDFDSVQRGDAEMALRTRLVIEACVKLGERNPIVSIHDQGAGGPCNVLTELVERAGGRIDISKVKLGDPTLSTMEIWGAEYQERYAIVLKADSLPLFGRICERFRCPLEELGEVTGDNRIVVHDSTGEDTFVDMPIEQIVGNLPQRTIKDTPPASLATKFDVRDLAVRDALLRVLRVPAVGSKAFLVNRVDHTVGGRMVQNQRCGPLGLPVADAAVSLLSREGGVLGTVASIGEQPLKTTLSPAAGVRMAIAEAITNMAGVLISDLLDAHLSGNIMWPGTKDGEMHKLYTALDAGVRGFLPRLGFPQTGGKDSMSMTARDKDGNTVQSPNTYVATLQAPVPDVRRVVTPDLKRGGESYLALIDIGCGRNRLGGSALAQTLGHLGDESPDIDNPGLLVNAFRAVQQLIKEDLLLAYHDRSDGGLITTLLEMAFAGNRAIAIRQPMAGIAEGIIRFLFSEEAGMVLEVAMDHWHEAEVVCSAYGVGFSIVGATRPGDTVTVCGRNNQECLREPLSYLRRMWEETSYEMDRLNINPACADEERSGPFYGRACSWNVTFEPRSPVQGTNRPATARRSVAVLRTQGTNGHEEIASFFWLAGFDVHDITMSDLTDGRLASLAPFRGIAFPGGFSYADEFGAGRGWAHVIQNQERLREMFNAFLAREDTFSLGVCNGCQLEAQLGWVPFPAETLSRGVDSDTQPIFTQNTSRAFESRRCMVEILPSPAIMFRNMAGLRLAVPVAHGEGRLLLPNPALADELRERKLVPLAFVDPDNEPTEAYPFNPNGSPYGWTALCDESGRHVAMMPHPERVLHPETCGYLPEDLKRSLAASPWLETAHNLYDWCCGN
ncbi:phosphoribosylformylglycinamidine synthase [Candidatus Berkelbacteria bacterium]|nr:phosphoribosylformylglycinamidine synthase [Candidatus Berkelbacteria bacterium]